MEKPRISPLINYGAMLQTMTVLISVGSLVWMQAVQTTENKATMTMINELKPVIATNTKANIEQSAQLNALTTTLTQLRLDQAAILTKLSNISEDLAAVKAVTKNR
jgi:hypothetical protein